MTPTAIDLPNLHAAIAQRRSLGLSRLKADPVPQNVLEEMLQAANWAPSNGDTEPWRFVVFTGEGRNQLADYFEQTYPLDHPGQNDPVAIQGYRDRAHLAPVWIAIGMVPKLGEDGQPEESLDEEIMAVACAVQNLHLVAAAHGLIGMWHSKGLSMSPVLRSALGWDEPARLLGMFFCGYPNVDWPEGERGPWTDKVSWVTGA